LKRGGGATDLTLPWRLAAAPTLNDSPMQALAALTLLFAGDDTSRKAAYVTQGWLPHLPSAAQMPREELQALVTSNLAYQIKRQSAGDPVAQAQASLLADK